MKTIDKKYDFKVVKKPWGYEYVAYRNKNQLALTYLNIDYQKETSLHCHPIKKTGFILLSGKAEIKLGFDNSKIYNAPEKLMIRPGLFHSIKAISKKGIIALEFETPVKKDDLVRYFDKYGRQKKPYENSSFFIKNKEVIKFKTPKIGKKIIYKVGTIKVFIESYNKIDDILKKKRNHIIAVLKGSMVDYRSKKVLSEGDIIRVSTVKQLAKKFKIKNSITCLEVN